MNETLEKFWDEFYCSECALIDTNEERELTKKAGLLHETVNTVLNKEQKDAVENYVSALFDLEAVIVKKAFFKGCRFAVSFLLETVDFRE